jgi:uncharacterized delta-60 repeat protein
MKHAAFISFVRATPRFALLLVSVAALLAGGTQVVCAQSALDGFDPNANGTIRAVAVQADGKILIGGDFTTVTPNGGAAVNRSRIARLNPDGTLDLTFSSNANANGPVNAIALQADGKILVGGAFTMIGGAARNNIARVTASGAIDSFDPNANLAVYAIAVQADGKILVGGDFVDFGNGTPSIGGKIRNSIARLDPTTGAADSWDPNANNRVRAIVVQADGEILVGGDFSFATPTIGGQSRNFIARLDPTTGLADSFNPNANSTVRAIAVQADGKILAGGIFTGIGGTGRNRIARLDPTSGAADSFNPNANNIVNTIAVQADGKILIGGTFFGATSIGGTTMRNRIARLDPTTGTPDTFDPNASSDVNAIAVQADGKVLAGGLFTTVAPNGGAAVTRNRIARMEIDGRLDQTLNLNVGSNDVLATAVQPDGKILIGGLFSTVLGVPRNRIARLNTDGTLDMTFDPNANSEVDRIAVQADGKILVGGQFNDHGNGTISIGGQPLNHMARLDATTGLADSFNPNANDIVYAIAVQADGKILAGGTFTAIGGAARNHIARLNPAGTLDANFDPNANNNVGSIAVQADGKILAGGIFTGIGGAARNHIARLDPTTGAADSFNPNANSEVRTIAVQGDGKILAGGLFTTLTPDGDGGGAFPRNNIARLNPAGTLDRGFDPNANGFVNAIAVQGDGKILAGGAFTTLTPPPGSSPVARNRIARLDATTGAPDSFDPNANNNVNSIALQADGKILASGTLISSIGGQPRSVFARLSNDTSALQTLAVTQTAITWTRGGSSPQVTRVTFESSTDNVNYTLLGNGTGTGNNWTLTGLNLQTGQNIYIRARGYYGSGEHNGSESITESVRNVFLVPPLANISTRLLVGTGDNALIGGFIVTGTQPKKVIVRAIGPSLPFAGKLADPTLELYQGSTLLESNDNWVDSPNKQAIIDSTIPPPNNLESAIVRSLPPGNYTAIERGVNNGTGIGVVEAYDLDISANSRLANISTRGLVQTGDNVLFAGTIVVGQASQKVIIRALGPSTGVPGAMADPTLELHDAYGALLEANDNWVDSPNKQAIIDSTIPPPNNLESAIVRILTPGNYTAIVRGVNNSTGIAVVEVYALN